MAAVDPTHVPEPPDALRAYFGTRVTACTFEQWLENIAAVLASGQRRWLSGHHNLHSIHLLRCNDEVSRFYARCNDCYIDGMSVRLLLKGFGISTVAAQRFTLMDHFMDLLRHAERQQWSVFYLGSQEAVVQSARAMINRMFPALRIHLQHGYSNDQAQVVTAINVLRPDILLVGMGMPLQERWLVEHIDHLDVGFAIQAGGTLDYYTGEQARPPRWISRMALAWLYRLLSDPLRLSHRYLLEPWAVLPPTLRHWHCHRQATRYRLSAGDTDLS